MYQVWCTGAQTKIGVYDVSTIICVKYWTTYLNSFYLKKDWKRGGGEKKEEEEKRLKEFKLTFSTHVVNQKLPFFVPNLLIKKEKGKAM